MNAFIYRRLAVAIVAAIVALSAAACGEDTQVVAIGGTDSGTTTPDPQAIKVLQFVQQRGDDQKACSSTCMLSLSYAEQRTLQVRYTENGKAVQNVLVQFQIQGDPNIAALTASTSKTDAMGVATISAQAFSLPGQVAVLVTLAADQNVSHLRFDLTVTPKGRVPLIVQLRYNGMRPINTVELLLFRQRANTMVRCINVDPYAIQPGADLSSTETKTPIAYSVNFSHFPNLDKDTPQNYTILAVGYEGQGDQKGPPLAWDCIDGTGDQAVSVAFAGSTSVSMELNDLPLRICPVDRPDCGYEFDNFFDIVSILPDEVAGPVNTVLDFFDEPSATLVSMICRFGGDVNALEELCKLIFNDPNNPCTNQASGCFTALGTVAFDLIDSAITGLIEDNLPGAFGMGQDVRRLLKELNLRATVTFNGEPDGAGYLAAENTLMEWHSLRYRWSYGALEGGASCPVGDKDCGWQSYNLQSLLGLSNVMTSQFSGVVQNEVNLSVEPFPLDLKYGALINFVLEKIVLPLLTGDQNVTTYEAFIGTLAGGSQCMISDDFSRCCENFGQGISDTQTYRDIAKAGCNALIGLAGEFLRSQLVNLSIGTDAAFTLSTQAPCRMFDNDNDMILDQIGLQVSEPQDKRCIWKVEVAGGLEGQAKFYGCRGAPCP